MKPISQMQEISIRPVELEYLFGDFNSETINGLINNGLSITFERPVFMHLLELRLRLKNTNSRFSNPLFIGFGKKMIYPDNPSILYHSIGRNYFINNGHLIVHPPQFPFPDKMILADFVVFMSRQEITFDARCFEKSNELRITA